MFHVIRPVLVREIGNLWYLLVPGRFRFHFFVVHDNLAVENLLLDTFVEIVRHGPDEHSLRERRDLRGRDQAVQLRGYGCRFVAAAQRHALPLLQYLTEPFRECLGRFTYICLKARRPIRPKPLIATFTAIFNSS